MRAVVETGGVVGQHQLEAGDVDARLVPVDQHDRFAVTPTLPGLLGLPWDDACLTSDEPRPRRSGIAPRSILVLLGVQDVGRRSPTWALWPALRQRKQPAERIVRFGK